MITFSKLGKEEFGRLGNQLFQIAATIGIAEQNNMEFIFPEWNYSGYFKYSLPAGQLKNAKPYKQVGTGFYKIILEKGDWDLEGFFQSELFFKNAEKTVRHFLELSDEINLYINEKYQFLLQKKTCSIHIRRGDYVKQKYHFPTQSVEYYKEAIKQFDKDTTFLFFSDDVEWCKKHFTGSNFYFVEKEKDIIDLFLMSLCNNHIISNSSFSWWGAWLNVSKTKRIICPEFWFGPAVAFNLKKYSADVYTDGFEKLASYRKGFIEKYAFFFYPLFFIVYTIYRKFVKAFHLVKN